MTAVGPGRMPAAEVSVSPGLVHNLLLDQHPDLADLPIEVLANGWDNVMLRLGDDLVVRLPRRAAAAQLVANEQRWLPGLAPVLPIPIPAPLRIGRAALGYPWPWSVVPFLPGTSAAHSPPVQPGEAARSLGAFLDALHVAAPADAPANPVRGVPLIDRSAAVEQRLDRLAGVINRPAVARAWHAALDTPPWGGPPCWLHGDLHPANILVDDGRLSAVIDFGDITSGDPATDLAVAWMLLPRSVHQVFRAAYGERGADDAAWARGRGWALGMSLAMLANSTDNPLMSRIGHQTLDAVMS